jgi:hypothetical protein
MSQDVREDFGVIGEVQDEIDVITSEKTTVIHFFGDGGLSQRLGGGLIFRRVGEADDLRGEAVERVGFKKIEDPEAFRAISDNRDIHGDLLRAAGTVSLPGKHPGLRRGGSISIYETV